MYRSANANVAPIESERYHPANAIAGTRRLAHEIVELVAGDPLHRDNRLAFPSEGKGGNRKRLVCSRIILLFEAIGSLRQKALKLGIGLGHQR